jgi:hypothetical protein
MRGREPSDEIDWKIVDQLHDATLKISGDCFEYKKLCVSVIAAVVALMTKFDGNHDLKFIFIICALVCVGFWVSDATAYYYQRILRRTMTRKINSIAARHAVPLERDIDPPSLLSAVFNRSMTLYFALLIIIIIALVAL